MLIKRLIFVVGAIFIVIGALLIETSFPISIAGPLLVAAGLVLALLTVFTGGRLLLGLVSILLGILV